MSRASEFTSLAGEAAQRVGDSLAPTLEAQVSAALLEVGRIASERLRTLRASPLPGEVLPITEVERQLHDPMHTFTAEAYRIMLEGTLGTMGIGFDVKNPLVTNVVEQLGRKVTNISETYRQDLMRVVDDGWERGLSVDDIAANVTEWSTTISTSRAAMIARTELSAAVNGGSLAGARIGKIARTKTWLATEDARTREDHSEVDGQVVGIDQSFQVGGADLQHPGDPNGPPEEVINCRCTLLFDDGMSASAGTLTRRFRRGVPWMLTS